MKRRFLMTPIYLAVVLAVLVQACASMPADRLAYTTIDTAVDTVKTAMAACNDLYQQGKLTEQERLKVIDAYDKFRAVAQAASKLAQSSTGPNPDVSRIISDAAVEALKVLNAFAGRT